MIDPDLVPQPQRLAYSFEYFSQEGYDSVMRAVQELEGVAPLIRLIESLTSALRPSDLIRTRLVITGNLVASVNAREDRTKNKYSTNRGSGFVAAKTMPPNTDGIVDILVPGEWILPLENEASSSERDRYLQHVAAHEAVHASLFNDDNQAFDTHLRREYDPAFIQFVSMAGHQVEEHVAEYLSNQIKPSGDSITAAQIDAAFAAWNRTLIDRLPVIPLSDPDYHRKCMFITLTALHEFWNVLNYFAAELRNGDLFDPVPNEISELIDWREEVAPWWDEYLKLLAQIPMSIPVNIEETDEVVDKIAHLLQRWAKSIGVDHHDTPEGPWFQLTRTY